MNTDDTAKCEMKGNTDDTAKYEKYKIGTAYERIENSKKRIAHALNLLEVSCQELKWACESMKWNDEVAYYIEDAIVKLGPVLATLVRWNDNVDVNEI